MALFKLVEIFVLNIIFVSLISSNGSISAAKCYQCSTLTDGISCYHLTLNHSDFSDFMVDCFHYCTIRREEYSDGPGGVAWLNRSCEEKYLNYVGGNGYFISYVRSCNRDLCNSGGGIKQYSDFPEYKNWNLTMEMKYLNSALNLRFSSWLLVFLHLLYQAAFT